MPRYKGHRCIIPNCNSGYDSNSEKVHLFSVPFDEELFLQWKRAISRQNFDLKSGMVVCEKHFLHNEIVSKREVRDVAGYVMASETLKKPHLKKNVIPSLSLNGSFDSENTKIEQVSRKNGHLVSECGKKTKLKKRKFEETTIANSNKDVYTSNSSDSNFNANPNPTETPHIHNPHLEENRKSQDHSHSKKNPSSIENSPSERNPSLQEKPHPIPNEKPADLELRMRINLFDLLFNAPGPKLPMLWCRRQCSNETPCIELSQSTSRMVDGELKFFTSKQIVIHDDMRIKAEVSGVTFPLEKLGLTGMHVSSVNELETLLENFEKLRVCSGLASPSFVSNVESSFAIRDSLGYLRHSKCSLVILPTSRKLCCEICAEGKKTMRRKTIRLKKITEHRRLPIQVTLPNKAKLNLLRSRLHKSNKQKSHYKRLQHLYKVELKKTQKEVSSFRKEDLQDRLLKANLKKNERTLIDEIIAASKVKSSKGRRYSEDWIILCLIVHMRSPAAYRLLRDNILPLPSTSTIRKYLSLMDTPCGFDEAFFKLLEESLSKLPQILRHGILLLDEISTRKNLRLDPKKMKLLGLTDFGDDELNEQVDVNDKADHGLVLMFHPLMESFTQPIAVCVSKGPVAENILAKLIIQAITLCEKAGAKVHGVVTDGASTNRKFWSIFGISGELDNVQSSFAHPTVEGRRIYVFSDIVHLIKNIRNRLHIKKTLQVNPNEPKIDWGYFRKLFEVDNLHGTGKWCPHLTADHIDPNNMLKMRVILAVQILSTKMADGLLKGLHAYPHIFEGCEKTSDFCMKMNNFFDILNKINPKTALRIDSKDFETLEDFLTWLDEWERRVYKGELGRDDCLTVNSTTGLRVTIRSTIELSQELLENYGFEYVLTGRINQDALERFFGTIRSAAGTNDHPCTPTFLQLYKILSAFSILKPPKLGNCTTSSNTGLPQPLITISKLKQLYKSEKKNIREELKEKLNIIVENEDTDFSDFVHVVDHDYSRPEVVDCLLYYTTERVYRDITKRVKCSDCLRAFLSTSNIATDTLLFSSNQLPRSFGAFVYEPPQLNELIHPNRNMYKLVVELEYLFQKYRENKNSVDLILREFTSTQFRVHFPCEEHKADVQEILTQIIVMFLQIRMREFVKYEMANVKKISVSKKKAAKLCAN